jgi:hypothetical protein
MPAAAIRPALLSVAMCIAVLAPVDASHPLVFRQLILLRRNFWLEFAYRPGAAGGRRGRGGRYRVLTPSRLTAGTPAGRNENIFVPG